MADMRQAAAIVMRRCCYLVILMVLAATPARGLQTVVQVSPVDCMRYAKDLNYLLVGSKSLVIILNATSLAEVARFDIVGAVPLVGDGISSRVNMLHVQGSTLIACTEISPLSALLDNSSADLPCALYDLGSLALLQRDEQPGGSAGERSNVVALSNNRLLGVRPAEGGGLSLLTFAADHTAAFMDSIALANVSDWYAIACSWINPLNKSRTGTASTSTFRTSLRTASGEFSLLEATSAAVHRTTPRAGSTFRWSKMAGTQS